MTIKINKFGTILISRPAGREAFAAARAYTLPQHTSDNQIVLDFAGVDVLSPSWADEFITGLSGIYKNAVLSFTNTDNPSVKETLEILSLAKH